MFPSSLRSCLVTSNNMIMYSWRPSLCLQRSPRKKGRHVISVQTAGPSPFVPSVPRSLRLTESSQQTCCPHNSAHCWSGDEPCEGQDVGERVDVLVQRGK